MFHQSAANKQDVARLTSLSKRSEILVIAGTSVMSVLESFSAFASCSSELSSFRVAFFSEVLASFAFCFPPRWPEVDPK